MERLSEHACFGGTQGFYRHDSDVIGLPMKFGVYVPPQAAQGPVPVLVYLAGLTCTEETFAIKAHAQEHAARHGLMLVTPDTSPRGTGVAGADAAWDFGDGAGFYLDATQAPWAQRWRMASYVTQELQAIIAREFPADITRTGLFGHSMGGHGALTLALKNPGLYRSVSAIAPIAAPWPPIEWPKRPVRVMSAGNSRARSACSSCVTYDAMRQRGAQGACVASR